MISKYGRGALATTKLRNKEPPIYILTIDIIKPLLSVINTTVAAMRVTMETGGTLKLPWKKKRSHRICTGGVTRCPPMRKRKERPQRCTWHVDLSVCTWLGVFWFSHFFVFIFHSFLADDTRRLSTGTVQVQCNAMQRTGRIWNCFFYKAEKKLLL